MPLNLQASDGDFMPFIKYNAKAGRWYIREDGKDGDQEVVNPVLAFDMGGIKTGWLFYTEGVGPEKVWDPSPSVAAQKPAGPRAFKRGFEVVVYGDPRSNAGRNIGVREFSSTAGSMISPVLEMYAEYEKGAAVNAGKVPVFACTGVKPITGKHGTNYSPIFKLVRWEPRSSIPFDGDGQPARQPSAPANNLLTLEEALLQCEWVGITKDKLREKLKARFPDMKGFNSQLHSQAVRDFILEATPPPAKQNWDNDPPPVPDTIDF